MPPKPKFADGEKVLCFNGPLLYEAKALKSSIAEGKQVEYLIHYVVSDEKEWVTENCVLKFNTANVYIQKVLSAENKRVSKPKKPDASGKDSDSDASTPWKEVTPADQSSSTSLNTPSTSRCRDAPKPASATTVTGTPNQEQNMTRELKRSGSERDSRDEGPKTIMVKANNGQIFESNVNEVMRALEAVKVEVARPIYVAEINEPSGIQHIYEFMKQKICCLPLILRKIYSSKVMAIWQRVRKK